MVVLPTMHKSPGSSAKPSRCVVLCDSTGIDVYMALNLAQANILFGSAFDEERYRKGRSCGILPDPRLTMPIVIYQCALEQDLALFAANDETEIGERGITLRYVLSE